MGGIFHPLVQGQIDGRTKGLQVDLYLFAFIQKTDVDFTKFDHEYCIGFGAGYTEGQQLRNQLKKLQGTLLFEEYIACCTYLFLKTQYCRISPQHYLEHIDKWHRLDIDYTVAQNVFNYINDNKIQKALNEIFEFYKTDFRLKALKDFDILLQNLKNLRTQKKQDMHFDVSAGKTKIVSDLKAWLHLHALKQ